LETNTDHPLAADLYPSALESVRDLLGLDQAEAARLLGCSRGVLMYVECRTRRLQPAGLRHIAERLATPPNGSNPGKFAEHILDWLTALQSGGFDVLVEAEGEGA
jgi:transcriptional regulator with XRE-family HTH domain